MNAFLSALNVVLSLIGIAFNAWNHNGQATLAWVSALIGWTIVVVYDICSGGKNK